MATMAEVAARAGVGIGTVSRVFSGSVKVSDEARVKVRSAAAELGYEGSRRRRAEQDVQERLIGVLVPFFGESSAFQRLRGIVTTLALHGAEAVLYDVESPAQAARWLVELPHSRVLSGLLVISQPLSADEGDRLARAPFPTVLVDTTHPALSSVGIDDQAGGALATRHLIEHGHRRIAFVGEPSRNPFGFVASANREIGFRRAMAAAGLAVDPELVRYGRYLHSAARQMAGELLRLPDPPTAIVAASDVQAVGCLEAAAQLGISVPEQLSVIGYDDIELAGLMNLTTIRQPLERSGQRGAEMIVEAMAMRQHRPAHEVLDLDLVVRGTTSFVRKAQQ